MDVIHRAVPLDRLDASIGGLIDDITRWAPLAIVVTN